MQTLTYGMQIPATGDIGSAFFPALEANFTQLDGHTHNGTDSAKLPGSSMTAYKQSVSSASWAAVSGVPGLYKQTVTVAGGLNLDDYFLMFKDPSGHHLFLTVEKVTTTSFIVYCNDNTLNLTAYYLN